ncbi:MAG: hypothetical protein J5710_06425 [Treponema sp.]|nr:hypothetical protein [Treponema sp.]
MKMLGGAPPLAAKSSLTLRFAPVFSATPPSGLKRRPQRLLLRDFLYNRTSSNQIYVFSVSFLGYARNFETLHHHVYGLYLRNVEFTRSFELFDHSVYGYFAGY